MSDGCRNGCRSKAVALQGLRPLRCFTVVHLCGVYSTIMKPSGDAVGAPMASTQCQPGERNCPLGGQWLPPLLQPNGELAGQEWASDKWARRTGFPSANQGTVPGRQASTTHTVNHCKAPRRPGPSSSRSGRPIHQRGLCSNSWPHSSIRIPGTKTDNFCFRDARPVWADYVLRPLRRAGRARHEACRRWSPAPERDASHRSIGTSRRCG